MISGSQRTRSKQLLRRQVETDPIPMLPFCQKIFEWMSEGNPGYLIGRRRPHLRVHGRLRWRLSGHPNARVDRSLLFLEGKLEQAESNWSGEKKIKAIRKQSLKADSPVEWLAYFAAQCRSPHDTYMNQVASQAEQIAKERRSSGLTSPT